MSTKTLSVNKPFYLESGEVIPELELCYTTYGTLNSKASNVIWIIHALTANSDPLQWWEGLVGKGKLFDPEKHFIVCCNNLGSCYGTTGPTSKNPVTQQPYIDQFPLITIRDMARVLDLLRIHLAIDTIHIVTGGSTGGQIALEWAVQSPGLFEHLIPIATNARHSAWGIAFNEAQRMALNSNELGLQAARAIALLSYRSYEAYNATQTDEDEKIDNFKSSSYQQYQGEKLFNRFDKNSYYTLTKAMDSHNLARKRGSLQEALGRITAKTLVIGVRSDILFPIGEQQYLASHIPSAQFEIIESSYGHDGFLLEFEQLTTIVGSFLNKSSLHLVAC